MVIRAGNFRFFIVLIAICSGLGDVLRKLKVYFEIIFKLCIGRMRYLVMKRMAMWEGNYRLFILLVEIWNVPQDKKENIRFMLHNLKLTLIKNGF